MKIFTSDTPSNNYDAMLKVEAPTYRGSHEAVT